MNFKALTLTLLLTTTIPIPINTASESEAAIAHQDEEVVLSLFFSPVALILLLGIIICIYTCTCVDGRRCCNRRNYALLKAIQRCNPDQVISAINRGANIHAHNAIIAAGAQFNDAANFWNGISINENAKNNYTFLHIAVKQPDENVNNQEIIQILLNKKVNVNAMDKGGNTPLHYAINRSHPLNNTVIKMLLCAGADLKHKNLLHKTPLDYAILEEQETILKTHNELQALNVYNQFPKTFHEIHPYPADLVKLIQEYLLAH
jgi:hypothetical protein